MLQGRFFRRVAELRAQLANAPELPFSELLSRERVQALLAEFKVVYRERIYTPCVTLWVFLSQVVSPDHSCREAVARFLAFRTAQGLPPCSTETGSYCEARQHLPEGVLSRLARQTGRELSDEALEPWRVRGRRVRLGDGTTVSMPDTDKNTAAFGKPSNQRGGGRFPVARLVVIFCLAVGSALDAAIGPCRGKGTGELSLFRSLDVLARGDLLLADRLYCTYCDIARLQQQGVDVIFRMHVARHVDFRRGRRLGRHDHLVTWKKPTAKPDTLSEADFAALPSELTVRELRVRVNIPGFRVRSLLLVTTLSDPSEFAVADVAELYRSRWHAELNLRSIKTVMQMDVLRCKSPEMVRKEIWAHLLAYNLLRSILCAAAAEHGLNVPELSFKGSLQLLGAFYHLIITSPLERLEALCTTLLAAVAQHRVGDRANRYEPRKRKRPAKPYAPLKLSRAEERKRCRRKP